jgi:hypothetical protein
MKSWQVVVILGLLVVATGLVFLGYERCTGGFVPITVTEQNGSIRTFTGVGTPVCSLLFSPYVSLAFIGLGATMIVAGAFVVRQRSAPSLSSALVPTPPKLTVQIWLNRR